MKIGTRVTAGFASMAVLLTAACGLGWTMASQQIHSTASERSALALTRATKQYQLDAAGVAVAENSIAYDVTSNSDASADLQSFAQSVDAARADSAALTAMPLAQAERSEVTAAGQALDAYVAQSNTINADFKAATPSSVAAANVGVAALSYPTVTDPLGRLEQLGAKQTESALRAWSASGSRDRLLVAGLMVAALILAVGVGIVVTRGITSRLRHTVDVLEKVAAGDLTRRIDVDSHDEVGQMGSALNVALDHVEERARGQKFESRLANALDMAEGEAEVLAVIERSFPSTVPDAAIELLMADNSHAHLYRMAASSPTGDVSGCSVDSPDGCPAARRAQVQHFSDSEALDACPKLRGRPTGPCQAICGPVSIMGRTVGVIHATRPVGSPFPESQLADLGPLAKLAGARIGMLRTMSDTQLQAATDSLTGLLNRRSFGQRVAELRDQGTSYSVAMADLDQFKLLNDTYGHPVGDRALILFAQTLRSSLRTQDIVGRLGGEEFGVAFPDCTAANAERPLEEFRAKLEQATIMAGLPRYTASFGVVDATDQEDLSAVLVRADAALYQAKRDGRDRVVVELFAAPPCSPTASEGFSALTSTLNQSTVG
jgi:diguanylate cyclase (GGDEF)-like protein